jgi:perosamine synthetase
MDAQSGGARNDMTVPLRLDFPAVQTRLTQEEIAELARAMQSATILSMGPLLQAFEHDFVRRIGVKHAFGVANATAALELAAMAIGVQRDDEVILPAHTFTATAIPFLRKGARLVFADIDPATFVMDVADVERKRVGGGRRMPLSSGSWPA